MPWHRIELPYSLQPGDKTAVQIDGTEILVCRIQDQYFALGNRCSHSAWPLSNEPIEGMEIICTLHGARFDIRDGCPTGGPASKPIPTFPIEVRAGELYVSL